MSVLFLRKISLIVAPPSGEGLDLSQLQIRFQLNQGVVGTPANVSIRVYNLADATLKKIGLGSYLGSGTEYTNVELQAGYQSGPFGPLFRGEIYQTRAGRESAIDSFLDIFASDLDGLYTSAVLNATLGAGYSQQDYYNSMTGSVQAQGGTMATLPNPPAVGSNGIPSEPVAPPGTMTLKMPRGRAVYGAVRDHLRDFTATNGMTWYVQDGQVTPIYLSGVPASAPIELNAATGLLGIPQQTIDGIVLQALINPDIRVGRVVHVNNADIVQTQLPPPGANQPLPVIPSVTTDGYYVIRFVNAVGDTRGEDWYMEMITESIDASAITTTSPKVLGATP